MKNNSYLSCKEVEKDGKTYTNFYLTLGDGLLTVRVDLKTFGDNKLFYRVKNYCVKNG